MSEIIYTSMEEAWLTPQTTRSMDALAAKQRAIVEANEAYMAQHRAFWGDQSQAKSGFQA